jgi:hypothetical protein
MLNCMHILVRTSQCGIHLNVTNSDRFLYLLEGPIPVKVLTWMRASNSQLSEWKLLLSPCLCILGNSHFLCQLLTGYSILKYSLSSDLPPLSEGFLNGPVLWVLWRTARTPDVNTALSRYSDVYKWLRTARNWGLAIVLPINKCTNNVWLQ